MRALLVCINQRWKLEAPSMSRYSEIINLNAMTAKLLDDGEVIAEYKVETCDKCARITQLDKFGYQKSDPANNLIWFCKECR
jgi:hypothetical protein